MIEKKKIDIACIIILPNHILFFSNSWTHSYCLLVFSSCCCCHFNLLVPGRNYQNPFSSIYFHMDNSVAITTAKHWLPVELPKYDRILLYWVLMWKLICFFCSDWQWLDPTWQILWNTLSCWVITAWIIKTYVQYHKHSAKSIMANKNSLFCTNCI